jgi:peptide/nickel transport system permease protein
MPTGIASAEPKMLIRSSVTPGIRLRLLWRKNAILIWGIVIVAVVLVVALLAPALAPYDPLETDYGSALLSPSHGHLLGTDKFGRDMLSRILYGSRIDLSVGIVTTFIPFIFGVLIGAISAYYGGIIDTVFMRIVDVQVAFPFYVLLIAIVAILGPGLVNMYYALILVGWVGFARLIRGEVLIQKNMDYVLAAKALGYNDFRIITRHLLPNVIAQAIVYSMSSVVGSILSGAALGFLGLGVSPPNPEWGVMIAESREYFMTAWWLPFFPGLAIAVVGIGFSLMGDGLSTVLRPTDR